MRDAGRGVRRRAKARRGRRQRRDSESEVARSRTKATVEMKTAVLQWLRFEPELATYDGTQRS